MLFIQTYEDFDWCVLRVMTITSTMMITINSTTTIPMAKPIAPGIMAVMKSTTPAGAPVTILSVVLLLLGRVAVAGGSVTGRHIVSPRF